MYLFLTTILSFSLRFVFLIFGFWFLGFGFWVLGFGLYCCGDGCDFGDGCAESSMEELKKKESENEEEKKKTKDGRFSSFVPVLASSTVSLSDVYVRLVDNLSKVGEICYDFYSCCCLRRTQNQQQREVQNTRQWRSAQALENDWHIYYSSTLLVTLLYETVLRLSSCKSVRGRNIKKKKQKKNCICLCSCL